MVAARDSGEEGSMGQRFEITSMRVGGWLRLHDTETGERFEVPLNVNTTLRPGDDGEQGQRVAKSTATPAAAESQQDTPPPKKKRRKSSSRKRASEGTVTADEQAASSPATDPSSPWAPGKQNPLETQEGRMTPSTRSRSPTPTAR
jgi:hypothetical protein